MTLVSKELNILVCASEGSGKIWLILAFALILVPKSHEGILAHIMCGTHLKHLLEKCLPSNKHQISFMKKIKEGRKKK